MRRFQLTVYVSVLAILVAGASDLSAQWPQFRGPNGSGVDSGSGYPVAFSPTNNVVWKATMPYGQSSPVVAGGRVYLTGSDGGKLLTISLDAGDRPRSVAAGVEARAQPEGLPRQRPRLSDPGRRR